MCKREEHCAFAIFNHHGRCIAYCHHNINLDDTDCTGYRDSDDASVNVGDNQHREIKI